MIEAAVPSPILQQKEHHALPEHSLPHQEAILHDTIPEAHPIIVHKPQEFEAALPQPLPVPIQPKKADLLPEFASFLTAVHLNPDNLDPVPIGQGANHVVFSYKEPGKDELVVKMPKAGSATSMVAGKYEEDISIKTIQNAFPGYTLPTDVREDKSSGKYCVVQKMVKGIPVTNHNKDPKIRKQVEEIARMNRELMKQQGLSLDFIGIPGFKSFFRRQLAKLFFKQKDFEVSNLIIDENDGKVYIIDYDFFQFHNTSLKKKIISSVSFFTNRVMMKRYFGVDIKG
ncbi:hypothetical protein COY90_02610 [Candidatus Roizmanbacteria bacterium CG_4_10_14_0_8_um_filter_39_9]|uniref:Uncharacterized protein n=1 Tax=Candidatus Roizmanbacteria bacterium CG_4_10_14_0_8_um_filter_39_9 TaxID=1974829 RepID=A0A2M7QCY0_9BACT|nr:MAG: hypothetical protein COY90_02610 [Candidatus Roizmanbacteria bacterium CG_4_10_14_0_8_um_filter_39_9]